jgi:hypothetical protein
MPFRNLDFDQKYPKYTWVELDVERNTKDFRPEAYRPTSLSTIVVEPRMQGKVNWDERRKIIFRNKKIYTNLTELINLAKEDRISIAIFKPTKLLDFTIEKTQRNWDPNKLAILHQMSLQMTFFNTPEEIEEEYRAVRKVPYKLSYRFLDDENRESTLMIEDWEIGMLYFHCLEGAGGDEKIAVSKVRQKYLNEFSKKDLHFFLGTTIANHMRSPNPFIIIGVFYPPHRGEQQMNLFGFEQ